MIDRLWQAYLRRFDIEHTFACSNKPSDGRARNPHPEQGDRWTWLILAAYTQLRLVRRLAEDLTAPGKPIPPDQLTPAHAENVKTQARACL